MSERNRNDEFKDEDRLGKVGRKLIAQERSVSFRCVHCKAEIPTAAPGTTHRNHCPLCLWSRHVDESIGDRKSKCLSSMEPMGLVFKNTGAVIMVVHKCLGCGKISKNRIAADDNSFVILTLIRRSLDILPDERETFRRMGIDLCTDEEMVRRLLYGQSFSSEK